MTTSTLRSSSEESGSLVREVGPFLGLAFGLSWVPWAVAVALGGDIAEPLVFALFGLGSFGPSLAAGVLALLGRGGERQARWGAAAGWVPAALLVGAFPAVVAAVVAPLVGAAPVDPSAIAGTVAGVGGLLPMLGLFLVTGPLAEEFGWRGHLQPRLRRRLSPAATSAVVGAVWALWHVPLFLLVGTSQAQMGLLSPAALLFFASMPPLSVGYWFVSERLRGGVPSAVLVHTAGNMSLTLLAVSGSLVGRAIFFAAAVVTAGALLALRRS
ncbi:CPBP family intramembrane glutamic endopeptidase [Pseudonocardia humida]|uniref:CPBP family intramembrane metalloprotease n=1 Tax=Pseudonocardia humida TaxID=2800819 RepID=A0ABT1A8W0_9PSEU|nr:CPBP family intramembrane glutamic endopeptidase [Pseudonocardia humida]MCO1659476.1 CPBP family intramembrane metalloprotease [Pseudonocardia humida]